VTLSLFDVTGREVRRIVDGQPFVLGPHEVHLDARGLRSGVYECQLKAGDDAASGRIVLIP